MKSRGRSAVGKPVFLDLLGVGLEQDLGAAMLADLLLGPLDHAVALARLGKQHLAGAGDLEALLGARFGLDLGHLALLCRLQIQGVAPGRPVISARNERADEHFAAATAALKSRAAGGSGYGRGVRK